MELSMMKESVTTKLAVTSVASVFAVMAMTGTFSYFSEKSTLEASTDRNARQMHERLISNLSLPMYQIDDPQVEAVIALEMKAEDVSSIVVTDQIGRFTAGKMKDGHGEMQNVSPPASE